MGLNKEPKNNIKIILLIILTLFILYILHISIGSYFGVESEGKYDNESPEIGFQVDYLSKILTVDSIYPESKDFYWNDITVASGNATLPYDTIDKGDQITNCEGEIKLVYELTGATIWEGEFS